ncbi:Synerg-CTERM sorting domain-containing protein [uncultured Fretibacterium sp.]|uniref:Synerg-CTERM sorting domain-containing protein n=1 Tax=uncultured Fretibacterium sp. TaxID=1678694 RepID=UPI0026183B57|nr:Synerg-CTERM sorting domain-containing protein [uncultured Fretibacterium sp.]
MRTMKARALCAAFSLALLIFLASAANAASWLDEADVSWYKEGQSWFVISTEAQLAGLTKLVDEGNGFENKTIVLSGDLNLEGKEWIPIGTEEKPFLGSLDGRGALIQLEAPLFGCVGSDGANSGTICGVNLSGDIRSREGGGCGALAEDSWGTIRNCSFTGSLVVGSSWEGEVYLGGLVGTYHGEENEEEVSGCRVRARLVAENVGNVTMGGVVGYATSLIRNCSFEGEFHCGGNGPDFDFSLGGIVGEADVLQDCRARFSVSFSGERKGGGIGGIAGYGRSLENCLAEWTCRAKWAPGGEDLFVGGIASQTTESVKNCVFSGDLAVGDYGSIGGILGDSNAASVSNCFARGRLSGGKTIGGVAGVNAGEIKDCSAACEVLPGAGATAGALVGDNQRTVSGCGWVSGLGPDNAVGSGEEPEGSAAVASESALPATSVVLTPFLGMLEGGTETVAAEVYPKTSNKSALSYSWTADEAVLNIVSPHAEVTEIKALEKGTTDLKLSCGGLPGGGPLTPSTAVTVRGLLSDPVSPDVPGPTSPDVPGPTSPDVPGPTSPDVPGPVSPDMGWIASADVSWYNEDKSEFTISTERQLAGLAKLANGGNTFQDKTVRLDADLNLVERDWTPIGAFLGTFDGQGHLIRIKSPLFGTIGFLNVGNNVGTVLNVNLSGDVSLVFNRNGQEIVGVLAREACGTIKNCSFTGSVSVEIEKVGEGSIVTLGGLIGSYGPSNKGTGELSDCRVRARMAVRGKDCPTEMGGIVALCGGTVRNCVFEGELFFDTTPLDPDNPRALVLGGIVADGRISIKDCHSRFSVSLKKNRFYSLDMGGVVGRSFNKNIENCLAEWTVSEDCWVKNESSIGGIAGGAGAGVGSTTILNCVFDGSLAVGSSPQIALGGIYGIFWGDVNSYNCFARGSLSGGGTVGGVAGKATGTIENSSAACKIETGPNAVSGAIAGNNAGAVKECRWVSGLGAERAVGSGAEPVSTDVVASESGLPATSIAVVPLLDLTENRDTPVKAEVYPQAAANKGTVGFSWTTVDKDVLGIGAPNAETALVKGIKEGMASLKLSCNGLLGGTTYNPTSSVTVRRVRLESLSLSPKGIELSQKGQKAEIHAATRPAAEVASFPQCDWSFKVVEGASAEADDIELVPTADGLGAAVTLVRPVSGAKYRVLAEAMDGSGLSDDVIVTVKYTSPAPTSPDVSPDVKPPLSPDVKPPLSPDVEPDVPGEPETGIAPKLPDGVPAGVGASKPAFFGGSEAAALKNAAAALSDSGLKAKDLVFDPDTGVVRLQSRVAREVARKVLPAGSMVKRVRTLPVLSATLPQGANVAAVGLELTGRELMAKKASEVELLKAMGPDTGALLKWSGKPEEFGDGRFTVLDGSGRVVDELQSRSRYVLTVFIGDGGKYDLDGEANGRVVDPLALLSLKGDSAPGPQPGPDGKDGGGGGCNAGLGWLLLLAAAIPAVLRRRG